jgi:neutral ceramidase
VKQSPDLKTCGAACVRLCVPLLLAVISPARSQAQEMPWKVGIAKAVITPDTPVWLAGYGMQRVPTGKLHDLWVKTLALEDNKGHRAVLVTTDHMGVPKGMYESMCKKVSARFGLDRSQIMFTFSHNHCGPRLRGDLVDYYPIDEQQTQLVNQYTDRVDEIIVQTVGDALSGLAPARLATGEGVCAFAVNRRENTEEQVPQLRAEGKPLKGVVDHAVPVLAVYGEQTQLKAILFGYACHPTTLAFTQWCGDYPGFAQIDLENSHPGVTAMFVNTCGADANPIPRLQLDLCEQYGHMLAASVEDVVQRPLKPVPSGLRTTFAFVDLAYEKVMDRADLEKSAASAGVIHARWAQRLLKRLDAGETFASSYPYPIHAWRLGDELLFIGLGGEAVVDYALRFKKEFGPNTWTCGYTDDLVAYIPSLRVWQEGGYEGGPHLDEYGHPALRWASDVEQRVVETVHRLVRED